MNTFHRFASLLLLALAARLPAQTIVAVSNYNSIDEASGGIQNAYSACSFTVGNEAASLAAVLLHLNTNANLLTVDIRAGANISTSTLFATTSLARASTAWEKAEYKFANFTGSTALAANSTYWVVMSAPNALGSAQMFYAANSSETGLTGWSVGDNLLFSFDNSQWHDFGLSAPQMKVEIAAVPEPATTALLLGGAAVVLVGCRRLRRLKG